MEQQTTSQSPQAPQPPKPPLSNEQDIKENKIWALLSYLGILFLIPLLAKKESKFCQFHAKQGLVFFIIGFVLWWFIWIPILGWLIGLVLIIVWIITVIKVLQGEYWRIPLVADVAEKLNI